MEKDSNAVAVLDAVEQVFGDITIEHEMSMLGEDQIDIEMDSEEIRNDSSFYNQSFESYAFQFDETIETNKDGNDSFLENLANLNEH